jgi:hypothetical protein
VTAARVAGGGAFGGAVLGAGFLAGRPAPAATLWALGVAAVLAVAAVRRLAADAVPADPREGVEPETSDLEQLRQVARQLDAARASSHGVERELRPLLRTIAAARLARRGVDLDRHEQAAQRALGPELWEIVRPGGGRGGSLVEGGLSQQRLHALLERLEAV